MTIQEYKDLIDLIVNSILNFWNMLRGMGVFFYAWVALLFILPWFIKLYRALKGR